MHEEYDQWTRHGLPVATYGSRPDFDSGPHMQLMAAAVRLARQDLSNPLYSASARRFLKGDLAALFAGLLGIEAKEFLRNA